jgi:hypothetical protein
MVAAVERNERDALDHDAEQHRGGDGNDAREDERVVALNMAAAKYAPIMYSEPCARFTKFMIPNTSVSPAASRNSRMPS